jgi:hypothetical protein
LASVVGSVQWRKQSVATLGRSRSTAVVLRARRRAVCGEEALYLVVGVGGSHASDEVADVFQSLYYEALLVPLDPRMIVTELIAIRPWDVECPSVSLHV